MSNQTDKLPTLEELAAADPAKTAEQRKPLEYPVHSGPRAIRIDRATGLELPPEHPQVTPAEKPKPKQKATADELPDKFKGKSAEEIARSYVELERQVGSMANELGHMRNIVERVANAKREDDLGLEKDEPVTYEDIMSDPTEAISKVVNKTLKGAGLEEQVRAMHEAQRLDKFRAKHPDFETDMQDAEFQKWVSESQYRQRLAVSAAQNNDYDAADELFTGWAEVKATRSNDDDAGSDDEDVREQLKRNAHLERGTAADRTNSSFGDKVYSSQDLLDLRLNDPDRYYSPQMQKLIMQAFLEGRVK